MTYFKQTLASILFLSLLSSSQAHTFRPQEFTCPIDGEKFSQVMDTSGTSFGSYLDLKPYGPTAAPWRLAQCPSNGFILFKSKFSKEELETLTPFVKSDEYQAMRKQHTTYYLAATLKRRINAPKREIAYTLLQASWQTRNRELYTQYATEALAILDELIKETTENTEKLVQYQLLAGELERRIQRFEQAQTRFETLAKNETLDPYLKQIIALQLKLIKDKNAAPERMPEKNRDQK